MSKKKQLVLKGAVILVAANLLVKVIGAGFKIPLAHIIDEKGMGYFGTAYTVYTFLFVIATAGFPVAISKMIAEARAREKDEEVRKIFRISLVILGIVGVIGTSAIYFWARPFADSILKNPGAYLAIKAISPAVFFVALMSVFRGYFQGHQNMYPTGISEVVEALGKLILGLYLAYVMMQNSLEHAAAGAVGGVSIGAAAGMVVIIMIYLFSKKKRRMPTKNSRSSIEIMKELFKVAIPITLGAAASHLMNLLDVVTVVNRLQVIPEIDADFANQLFGRYNGYATPMFNMPLTLVVGIAMSIVPAISGALALKKRATAREIVDSVLRITMLFALPCAVGLGVLAGPILTLLYNNANATSLLQNLSPAVLFVAFLSITNAILQSYNKAHIPIVNMIIGGILKLVINYTMIPVWGIDAAPIATGVCYFVIVASNMFFVLRYAELKLKVVDFFVKPIISAALMGAAALMTYNVAIQFVGNSISCLVAIMFAILVYGISLFLTRAIRKEDVEMLPKGEKISEFLAKYHLIG